MSEGLRQVSRGKSSHEGVSSPNGAVFLSNRETCDMILSILSLGKLGVLARDCAQETKGQFLEKRADLTELTGITCRACPSGQPAPVVTAEVSFHLTSDKSRNIKPQNLWYRIL
jgi:hypothetical protein